MRRASLMENHLVQDCARFVLGWLRFSLLYLIFDFSGIQAWEGRWLVFGRDWGHVRRFQRRILLSLPNDLVRRIYFAQYIFFRWRMKSIIPDCRYIYGQNYWHDLRCFFASWLLYLRWIPGVSGENVGIKWLPFPNARRAGKSETCAHNCHQHFHHHRTRLILRWP